MQYVISDAHGIPWRVSAGDSASARSKLDAFFANGYSCDDFSISCLRWPDGLANDIIFDKWMDSKVGACKLRHISKVLAFFNKESGD